MDRPLTTTDRSRRRRRPGSVRAPLRRLRAHGPRDPARPDPAARRRRPGPGGVSHRLHAHPRAARTGGVRRVDRDDRAQSRDRLPAPDARAGRVARRAAGGDPIETETFAILEIVRRLPEAYRETLLMRLVEGMSGNEIAERSGLTPASVRVNLHRGMKLLRERSGRTPRGGPGAELSPGRADQGRRLPIWRSRRDAGSRRRAPRADARPAAIDDIRALDRRQRRTTNPTPASAPPLPRARARGCGAIVLMVGLTWQTRGPAALMGGRGDRRHAAHRRRAELVGEGRIAVGQTLTTGRVAREDGGQRHRPGDGGRADPRAPGRNARRPPSARARTRHAARRRSPRRRASSSSARRRRPRPTSAASTRCT